MSETVTLDRPSLRYPAPDGRRLESLSEGLRDDGYDRSRLATGIRTAKDEQELIRAIQRRDPTVNGNVKSLAEDLPTYSRQAARKETLYKRNEADTKPATKTRGVMGRAWDFVKKHKVAAVVGVTALLGFLAYHYGIPLAQFSGAGGDARTGGVANTLRRLGRFAPGGDTPAGGELPAAPGGTYGSFTPPPNANLPGN